MSRGGLPGSEHRCDPGSFFAPAEASPRGPRIASVVTNALLCREHLRLTLHLASFPPASPGQFVHLCAASRGGDSSKAAPWSDVFVQPMLRRAFSIAGLRRAGDGVDIDVIYRVVGAGTRWMQSLHAGDAVSVLGPLGNAFPISAGKRAAWMVAGGVGLPPMLWLAEALHAAGKQAIAFCGAQRAELLALTLDPGQPADAAAARATPTAREFALHGTPVILSTDDGSVGFRGYVGSAMAAHFAVATVLPQDLVVYTCGPERMMHAVAEFCTAREIECHVCVERNMACGTGMCQSCVVPVHDTRDPAGWSYRLCCTDGPIFEAREIRWEKSTERS